MTQATIIRGYHFVNFATNKHSPKKYIQVNVSKLYAFKVTPHTLSKMNMSVDDRALVKTQFGVRNLVVKKIEKVSPDKAAKLQPVLKFKKHKLTARGQEINRGRDMYVIINQ